VTLRGAAVAALAATALSILAACGGGAGGSPAGAAHPGGRGGSAAANPVLDSGTVLPGLPAPDIRLVNQFGQPMALSQFRGKAVILAFTDSLCTSVCPLTTASMLEAKRLLGAAASRVQLLGVDANPTATSVADAMAYSRAHGMVNQWDFLTGTPAQLTAVWRAYHIAVQIQRGQIDHTPALFVIDPAGRERKLYLTQMSFASVGQAAHVLAAEAASLLPGHPRVASGSLAYVPGLGPHAAVTLPRLPSGTVKLGPGRARLLMFFASWLAETSSLRARLRGLNRYAAAARHGRLAPLTAVDEAATEPSAGTVLAYLRGLHYPVASDQAGRVADGYGVQDQPWFVLVSPSGQIVWRHDGWLGSRALERAARKATR
jgi:cytochrome oxidase Cu insertion factor (SCO1/SenC/PrrC family)